MLDLNSKVGTGKSTVCFTTQYARGLNIYHSDSADNEVQCILSGQTYMIWVYYQSMRANYHDYKNTELYLQQPITIDYEGKIRHP